MLFNKLNNFNLQAEGGFTLIELLIVIAVLAILATVVIPQITDVRGQAEISAIQSSLRNAVSVIESQFLDENVSGYDDAAISDAIDSSLVYTVNTDGDAYIIRSENEIQGDYYYIQSDQMNEGIQISETEPTF